MHNNLQPRGVPAVTMTALVLAVFTVSVGYGVVLPFLPDLVERLLAASGSTGEIARHTGLLTGAYAMALFLGAPAWGRLSDSHGRRNLLVVGLLGFGAATLAFSFAGSLTTVYVQRFLSGLFAAAITPLASATIGDLASAGEGRGRRLAFVSMASIAGFLLGPTLGVFAGRIGADFFAVVTPAGSLALPLASIGLLAGVVSVLVALAVPNHRGQRPSATPSNEPRARTWLIVNRLLVLTFVVSAGVGAFEVGLALRGTRELGLTPYQLALMFMECSLVMFLMQAAVFSPLIRADTTRWLISPGLFMLVVALSLVPWTSGFWSLLVVTGGVAASAGSVSPVLTYWISIKADSAQGWALGKQTSAASLGVTLGSAAGGLLFNVGVLPGGSFVPTAVLIAVGFLFSLRLPRILAPPSTQAGA